MFWVRLRSETDSLLQGTVRKRFAPATVITIAHRFAFALHARLPLYSFVALPLSVSCLACCSINTIVDSSRVLVLANGRVRPSLHLACACACRRS